MIWWIKQTMINGPCWFLMSGWRIHPTPNHLIAPLDPTILATSRVLHGEFWPPDALFNDPCPNNSVFSLLNLTSTRQFQSSSPFEHFKGVILPELSLVTSSSPKGSLLTLLAANLQITTSYLSLWPCALFATEIFQSSFWIYKIQGLNWPTHSLHNFVLHLHFSWYENNGISSELSEIKLSPLQRTPCGCSLHSLQEFSGRETIETHSSPLSDFIHSTQNNNKGITKRIKQL